MVENAFRIGLDPIFQPPLKWPASKRHLIQEYSFDTNRFELVFDEQIDSIPLAKLYKDQPFLNCISDLYLFKQ
jgi:hypothetical protein